MESPFIKIKTDMEGYLPCPRKDAFGTAQFGKLSRKMKESKLSH